MAKGKTHFTSLTWFIFGSAILQSCWFFFVSQNHRGYEITLQHTSLCFFPQLISFILQSLSMLEQQEWKYSLDLLMSSLATQCNSYQTTRANGKIYAAHSVINPPGQMVKYMQLYCTVYSYQNTSSLQMVNYRPILFSSIECYSIMFF